MKSLTYFLTFLLLGISFQSKSQHRLTQEWQAWFRYYNQARLSEKTVLHFEFDERKRLNPWGQFQIHTSAHLHDRIKPWLDIAVAVSYVLTKVSESLTINEWRLWQEASVYKKIGKDLLFLAKPIQNSV